MEETGLHDTLDKLARVIEKGEPQVFDDREVATIRRMILTYEGFESFGRAAEFARGVVIWLGVMLGAYFAFTGWFTKFVRGIGG